jgi:hypothetical protein
MYAERLRQLPVIPDGVDFHLTLAETRTLLAELTPQLLNSTCVELWRLRALLEQTTAPFATDHLASCS